MSPVASGSLVLYHIGKKPPRPQPYNRQNQMDNSAWERPGRQPVKSGVFLSDNPIMVAVYHGIRGNVYAYKVSRKVIQQAGGIRRFEQAREVLIPNALWEHVDFLGKKMSERDLEQAIKDAQGYSREVVLYHRTKPHSPFTDADETGHRRLPPTPKDWRSRAEDPKIVREKKRRRVKYKQQRLVSRSASVLGPYVDSVIDGVKVTQVNTDNRRSGASLRGNKLLIKWGLDAPEGSAVRKKYLPKWVKWAAKKLGQKKERVEQKKEWSRSKVGGYSVYDLEGKEEVAAIISRIERDVRPILREFGLRYKTIKESVAEGSLGFNRGGGSIIALNVRQKRNPMKLRKYSAVMATMVHELAHVRHMNHGPKFKAFEQELREWARSRGIYAPGRTGSQRVATAWLLRQS